MLNAARNASSNLTPLRFSGLFLDSLFDPLFRVLKLAECFPLRIFGASAATDATIHRPKHSFHHKFKPLLARLSDDLTVSQQPPLALRNSGFHPFPVRHPSIIPAEFKFGCVTRKMLAAHMMPRAMNPAL